MQVRLQGETARLASALRELGKAVERQHFIRDEFDDSLVAVHEAAQMLAAAIFPRGGRGVARGQYQAVGLREDRVEALYGHPDEGVRQNRITPEQQAAIESIADSVAAAFAEVNTLLNDLAESRAADADALRRRLDQAPLKLTITLQEATERLQHAPKAIAGFAPVIKASKKIRR